MLVLDVECSRGGAGVDDIGARAPHTAIPHRVIESGVVRKDMSIADYTYVTTLGRNCMPSFQLTRAAGKLRWPDARISGPFDWFGLGIEQVIQALDTSFRQFFDPRRVTVDGVLGDETWKVTDASGSVSWHHLRREMSELEPSTAAWFAFGCWLGRRLTLWQAALADPSASVLVVRLGDAAEPDSPDDLRRLTDALVKRAAGRLRVAAVGFTQPPRVEHPNISTFAVQPTWPAAMDPLDVDWNTDYGFGVAWKGHDTSWEALWQAV